MFEAIIILVLTLWAIGAMIKLSFHATWGLLKLTGIILSAIAFPVIIVIALTLGVCVYLALPILLIVLAAGCLVKA